MIRRPPRSARTDTLFPFSTLYRSVGFEPRLPGFAGFDFNDLAAAEAAITDETAGFMLEPVQGEGGIRPATQEFLSGLRALCDKHGLLQIGRAQGRERGGQYG